MQKIASDSAPDHAPDPAPDHRATAGGGPDRRSTPATPDTKALIADPYASYRHLREAGPVHRFTGTDGLPAWLVTDTSRQEGDELVREIESVTGRSVKYARDSMHARTADHREASHLGVPVGTPVLGMAHDWSDDEGVIVYGEAVLPELLTIGYQYDLRSS